MSQVIDSHIEKSSKNTKVAFVFPGQGSQALMMGKSVYDNYDVSKEVFEEVNDALSMSLSSIIFGENIEELNITHNTQPALMTVSIAILRAFEKELGKKIHEICNCVAGHSLGEYSALCANNSFNLSEVSKILKVRGAAMSDAATKNKGLMVALIGGSNNDVLNLIAKAKEDSVLVIANDNSNSQVVLSGEENAIERVAKAASEFNIKRAVILPVSGAFHSPLMEEARKTMEQTLSGAALSKPSVEIIPNVLVKLTNDVETIRQCLIDQITGQVRWRETIDYLYQNGYTHVFEIGSGKVLSGLVKKTQQEITVIGVETKEDILNAIDNYGFLLK